MVTHADFIRLWINNVVMSNGYMQMKYNQRFKTKWVEHFFVWKSEQRLTCRYSSRVIVPSLSVSCMLNKTAEKSKTVSHMCVNHRWYQAYVNVTFFKTHISVSPSWRSHAVPQSCSVTGAWNGTWPPGTPQSWSPQLCPHHSDDSFWRNIERANKLQARQLWQHQEEPGLHYILKMWFWYSKGYSTIVRIRHHHCTFCQRKLLWSVHGWDCMTNPGFYWSALSWWGKKETHTVLSYSTQLLPHVTSGMCQHEVKR